MATQITTTDLATAALNPAEIEGDAGRVKEHSLPDQIAADKYLRSRAGASNVGRGIRFGKMIMPGHTGTEAP